MKNGLRRNRAAQAAIMFSGCSMADGAAGADGRCLKAAGEADQAARAAGAAEAADNGS